MRSETAKPMQNDSAPASPSSPPCAYPWKKAKKPTITMPIRAGTCSATSARRPSTTTEAAITGSTKGRPRPASGHGETGHHRADEGGRHQPDRTSPEQRGPQADGDHGEDVVEAEQRMRDASHEGTVLGGIEMREGGCNAGSEQHRGCGETFDHRRSSFMSAGRIRRLSADILGLQHAFGGRRIFGKQRRRTDRAGENCRRNSGSVRPAHC